MALPPSGTITMAMLAAEFGGSTPHALSEYYRGGGLVPNIPANSGVPTSGTIGLANFYNSTAASPVNFGPLTYNDTGSGTRTATVTQRTDGTIDGVGNISAPTANWFLPTTGGIGASYWVKCTVLSGSLSSGTTGSVLSCNSVHSWAVQRTTLGASTAQILLEFYSDAGGTNLVCSGTVNLYAERDT